MPNQAYPISKLDPSDERWMVFVRSFPHANIFHHPAWVRLLSECYGYQPFIVACFDENGEICAGLPFLDVNSFLTGRRCVALPFTDYCPPLYRDQKSLERLTEGLVGLSKDDRYEVRWEMPSNPGIKQFTKYVWHSLNLDSDPEVVLRLLHRTQRQNIKTAEKNGIQIELGRDLEHLKQFYDLHSLTRRRQGTPVQPWRFFELILKRLVEEDLGFILLAYHDDQCLAAGLFLHWQTTLAYKYAASSERGQDLRPNHLINWTAIRWGCENGYKVFDFGRTDAMNEGLRTFKHRWGAEEKPLSYSVFSGKPFRTPDNGKISSLMNNVIRKSPTWVCRLTGELLYRHFG